MVMQWIRTVLVRAWRVWCGRCRQCGHPLQPLAYPKRWCKADYNHDA